MFNQGTLRECVYSRPVLRGLAWHCRLEKPFHRAARLQGLVGGIGGRSGGWLQVARNRGAWRKVWKGSKLTGAGVDVGYQVRRARPRHGMILWEALLSLKFGLI